MNCEYSQCSGYETRNFLTKIEKIELLKEYKENLEQEVKGISERITELEKDA